MDHDRGKRLQESDTVFNAALPLLDRLHAGKSVTTKVTDALRSRAVCAGDMPRKAWDAERDVRCRVIQLQLNLTGLAPDVELTVVDPDLNRSRRVLSETEVQPLIGAVPSGAGLKLFNHKLAAEHLRVGQREEGALPDVVIGLWTKPLILQPLLVQYPRKPTIVRPVDLSDDAVVWRVGDKPAVGRAFGALGVVADPVFSLPPRSLGADGRNQLPISDLRDVFRLVGPVADDPGFRLDAVEVVPKAGERIADPTIAGPDVLFADVEIAVQPIDRSNRRLDLLHRGFVQAIQMLPASEEDAVDAHLRELINSKGRPERQAPRLS
ncbi:hypothetical protein D3C86_1374570 [compost metagenome]